MGSSSRAGAMIAVLSLALLLAACGNNSSGGPAVPYGIPQRPGPGGTLAPLPTTGLVPAAALSATPPPAPTPGPSAVPSPTPPKANASGAQNLVTATVSVATLAAPTAGAGTPVGAGIATVPGPTGVATIPGPTKAPPALPPTAPSAGRSSP